MSLIDKTYFVGDISLPNVDNNNTLTNAIDQYEEDVLKKLLGYDLYKEFIAEIQGGSPAQKWIDFRDGKEFTFEFDGNTISTKWEGLINANKRSLISYYVYAQYRDNRQSTTTGINDVRGIPENAEKVHDSSKIVSAFNRGIVLYGEVPRYWFDKFSTTYEFYNDFPSAYNFLNANRTDYPGWLFEPIERVNNFGL